MPSETPPVTVAEGSQVAVPGKGQASEMGQGGQGDLLRCLEDDLLRQMGSPPQGDQRQWLPDTDGDGANGGRRKRA